MTQGALHGKVCLITGSAQGIGLATVKLFIEEGAKVVASDVVHLDAPAAAVAETLKSGKGTPFASNIEEVLLTVKCDVTKEDEVIALCEAAMSRFGQIDAAIFNAGLMSPPQPWVDCDAEVFDRVTAVNTRGPWLCTKHVVRSMRASPHGGKGGSLVYVSSQGGLEGTPTISSYGASKWAMRGLSLSAAQEFAEFGIRSNAVCPGLIDTPFAHSLGPDNFDHFREANTFKRAADPREVSEAFLFFCSERSSFCNGSTLAVHAGVTPT